MPTATRSAAGSKAPAPRPRVGTKKLTIRRLLACSLTAAAVLFAPQAASASSSQLSIFEDDRELLGFGGDPAEAMAELRFLGVDVVRVNVIHYVVHRRPRDRSRPRGFNASDPNSPLYDWSRIDRFVELARANGLQVMLTITGPGPFYTSASPRRCRRLPCTFRPKPSEFGGFATAVAKRYRGQVDYYAIWNEPNIENNWLTPRFQRTRHGRVDVAGAIYRKLFQAGQRAVARNDPGRRNRVLFGEVAAVASPLPLLRAALCLDADGRPFRGRLKALQGCSGRVARLNIGGFSVHPYNFGGYGSPRSTTVRKTALPLAYMPRLHRLMDGAARRGRIGRGKGIYVTEHGFQTRPPDSRGVSPANQARYINESDRLFFADRRVRSVAQYELFDDPRGDQFNSGLRYSRARGGGLKPSYKAYRLPLVVTRRSASSVEVYGQVRPARLLSGGPFTRPLVQAAPRGGAFTTVATPTTNRRGIFRINVRRAGAASSRWRILWGPFDSREATAGPPLRYRRG